MKKEFLEHMKSHPFYELFIEDLKKNRPQILPYDPDEDNTEKWKFLSAQQKGFDLCCSFFQIKQE